MLLAWTQPGAAQTAKPAEMPTLPSIEVAGGADDGEGDSGIGDAGHARSSVVRVVDAANAAFGSG